MFWVFPVFKHVMCMYYVYMYVYMYVYVHVHVLTCCSASLVSAYEHTDDLRIAGDNGAVARSCAAHGGQRESSFATSVSGTV
eukprot:gene19259-biopygen4001